MVYKKCYEQYEGLEQWEKLTIGQQLASWSREYKDRIAIVEGEKRITYKQLYDRAAEIADAFLQRGIKCKDRVVIQLPNGIAFTEVFFATILLGAIPILALPAHRRGDLEGIFKLAEPTAYIIAETYLGYSYAQMAKELKEAHESVKHIFVDGEESVDCISLKSLTSDKEEKIFAQPSSYDTAILLLSGGTTGTPKLIPRTHTDYMYNAKMAAKKCGLNESTSYLSILPIAHNFSLSSPGLLGVLSSGGKVVMCPSSSPDEALPLIEEEKITITALVPALINVFSEMMEWDLGYDLSSWEILQVGGALLEESLAKKVIRDWPCKLMQVFGTAEGLICFTDLNDSEEVITQYQGKPISIADEIKIIDENGEEVENGSFGQLITRGPYTIDGYYKLPEVNKECITSEGFYCTGDRASWDPKLGLKMAGRIKEQINRAGEKVIPSEIEAYLCQHEKVLEAAVVGVPDSLLGHRSCAFLILKQGENITLEEINLYFKERGVAIYKIPDQIFLIDSWPVTSVGKVDKKELIRRVLEEESV